MADVDAELTAWTTAVGTKVVTLLATEMWAVTKDAVVALWRRRHPERAEAVEGELVDAHSELVTARESGDEQVEQDLVAEWQSRLWRVLAADPEGAAQLRRILEGLTARLPAEDRGEVDSIDMRARAGGHGRIYQVGQGSISITEK